MARHHRKPLRFSSRAGGQSSRRVARIVGLIVAVTAPYGADAQSPTPVRGIDVTIKTIADGALRAELLRLSPRDGLVLQTAAGKEFRVPFEDLVRLETDTKMSSRSRRDSTFTLSNGDVVYGTVTGGSAEDVDVDTLDLGRVLIPLDSIARFEAARADTNAYRASVAWLDRAAASAAEDDHILLTNGDIVRGLITGIDADGIVVDTAWGDTRGPAETVVPHRLIVAALLVSPRAADPARPFVLVTLRSSGRVTVTDFRWSGQAVRARPLAVRPASAPDSGTQEQHLRIEAERIVRLEFIGGRWEALSRHRPISYQHTPMLSLGWEYRNDHNVLGGPIRVAGSRFEHGVGVHSRSVLVYDLRGEYSQFVASFGIDDDSGPYADVTVSIRVDGQRRLAEAHVRRGRLYGPVRLDIRGANRIELITDFGDNGDLQDRFNWVEPALIR